MCNESLIRRNFYRLIIWLLSCERTGDKSWISSRCCCSSFSRKPALQKSKHSPHVLCVSLCEITLQQLRALCPSFIPEVSCVTSFILRVPRPNLCVTRVTLRGSVDYLSYHRSVRQRYPDICQGSFLSHSFQLIVHFNALLISDIIF